MKCLKCKKEGVRYLIPRPQRPDGGWQGKQDLYKRRDFKAKCKCGWEGRI